jgi:putative transcriptional regulator
MIINTVTKWRQEKGVTKAHLARRVGVKRSYMTKLEQGKMQPSGEMMFRIAKYLGQPLEAVFQHVQATGPSASFCEKVMPDSQIKQIFHPCPAADRNTL